MEDYSDIDENPYSGMTGQEVLMLKRRELETLYSEIKLLDEALPRGRDEPEPIVSESEAYAMIMDLRSQLKMAQKNTEALSDEKKVLDRLIRTKDQALVQLTSELQTASENLLKAEGRIREADSVSANEAQAQKANTAAAIDAAAEKTRRNMERDLARVAQAKKERPDAGDPFYDLVIGLENKNAQLEAEIDTLNKHVRLLTGENRRKDRIITQLTEKLEENSACHGELAEAKIDRLAADLSDVRRLYTKLIKATTGAEEERDTPLSPGGERALTAMEIEEVREVVRNKQRIIKVLEEENAAMRDKQMEWEQTQMISIDDGNTAAQPTMIQDYNERRLLHVELKKLREGRVLQDKTIRAQQQRLNQLTDRLDFIAKSLRTASKAQRRAIEDTKPVVELDVPPDNDDDDDVVSSAIYDLVVSQLIDATRLNTELQETLNERQMVIERSEKAINVLQRAKK